MIGLDILHLPRIRTILQKKGTFSQRFVQRILHQNESRSLPTDQESLARYLGTRFAAKEAAYKAFQPARKVQWKDLEVWKHQSGKPYLRLWQEGKKVDYPLSISHEEDYVVAVVMNMPITNPESSPELNTSPL